MAENKPHGERPSPGFEERDVNVWAVGRFGIGLAVVCVICLAVVFGAFKCFEHATGGPRPRATRGLNVDASKMPPEPRLEVTPILDLKAMRDAEDKALASYGWIDKSQGVVRIPIARAIDLVAQRGLPARNETAPVSAASGVSVPTESGLGEQGKAK